MDKMWIIYFTLGAISMIIGMIIYPHVLKMRMHIMQYFTRKKHTPNVYCDDLQSQIKELEKQINNVAERLSTRDTNRKHQVRREIRDYLEELRTK